MNVWLRWLPSVLGMAAIYYFSSRTGDDLGGWLDKFAFGSPLWKASIGAISYPITDWR